MPRGVDNAGVSIDHYENFPVASWLCPPALRPPILAIYRFARTADDIADEGLATPVQRQAELIRYRAVLARMAAGEDARHATQRESVSHWREVFVPLQQQMRAWHLPPPLLDDLLDAFLQDSSNPLYPDRACLLDYCRRSANPIGRLLLHLYRIDDGEALARSDDICTALQLINFWQDLSVDLPRGRIYVPQEDALRHGLSLHTLGAQAPSSAQRALLAELLAWAVALMQRGAPLVHRLPGRTGWELRLVVQGGLRIAEKIARLNHPEQPSSWVQRPVLSLADSPVMLWRAARM